MQGKNRNNGTRTRRIHIRASEGELTQLREQATKAGLRLSDYLRHAGIEAQIVQPIPEAVTRSIGGFGRNLNQLCHALHIANLEKKMKANALEEVESLRSEAKKIVALLQRRN